MEKEFFNADHDFEIGENGKKIINRIVDMFKK